MENAVVVAWKRTPIGRARKGSLASVRPDDLAAGVVRAALEEVPELSDDDLDDLLMGCAQPGGEAGYNLGRAVAVQLGHDDLPGATVNRYCASSLQAARMGFHAIAAGEGDAFVVAGVECASRFDRGMPDGWPDTTNPMFAEAAKRTDAFAHDGSPGRWRDPRQSGQLPDLYMSMGLTAEHLAQRDGISRQDMDDFAVRSHRLAVDAQARGFWAEEIASVELADGTVVERDDCPRPDASRDALAALRPAFRVDGLVTAGNSCPLNDGAAALVMMSESRADELQLQPIARVMATSVSGLSPEIIGFGPVESTRRVLKRAGLTLDDIDLVEMNEAFAAQVLASQRGLQLDLDRVNVNGGALALGHPFGMTGVRLIGTLAHALRDRDKSVGLVTLCVGGGQGMSVLLERMG